MHVTETVFGIIKDLSGMQQIEHSARLQEDMGLDSLNMVTLLLEVEDAFEIELEEKDMNPFELIKVEDVIELVERYKGDSNE